MFSITGKVQGVQPGSAVDGKVESGDVIESFTVVVRGDDEAERAANLKKLQEKGPFKEVPVELDEGQASWPTAHGQLQAVSPEMAVKLVVRRGETSREIIVRPSDSDQYNNAMRGIRLSLKTEEHVAQGFSDAVRLGLRETGESLTMVVTFLRKLITGQLSPTNLGGPGTIFAVASMEASAGTSRLLIFLTMLSANLAVINFLPIPVLDGGHMLFLAYEGIRRKPVNEELQIKLTVVGFIFLLGLMGFVICLDVYNLGGFAG